MTDETPAEKAEARAIRRRWISIGEAVAVAGVVIAGLTFWSGYRDRQDAAAEKRAESVAKGAERRRVPLTTASVDKAGVTLAGPRDCALQSADVRFPKALGVDAKTIVAPFRIESDWLAGAMLRMTDGGADRREGRLPVLVTATCSDDDGDRRETATYDLLWKTEPGGLIGGRAFRLSGLVRRQSGGDGRRLDAWQLS